MILITEDAISGVTTGARCNRSPSGRAAYGAYNSYDALTRPDDLAENGHGLLLVFHQFYCTRSKVLSDVQLVPDAGQAAHHDGVIGKDDEEFARQTDVGLAGVGKDLVSGTERGHHAVIMDREQEAVDGIDTQRLQIVGMEKGVRLDVLASFYVFDDRFRLISGCQSDKIVLDFLGVGKLEDAGEVADVFSWQEDASAHGFKQSRQLFDLRQSSTLFAPP